MAFVPFPTGTVSMTLEMTVNGIPCVMTWGAQKAGGAAATAADGLNLALGIGTWCNSDLAPICTTSTDYLNVVVYDLTSAAGWVANSVLGFPGQVNTATPPNNVAMTITLQTALRGRSQRGRNFLIGLPASDLLNELSWSSAAVSTVDTVWGQLDLAIGTAGFSMGVLSRQTLGVPRVMGQFTPLNAIRANQPIKTQRGRLT